MRQYPKNPIRNQEAFARAQMERNGKFAAEVTATGNRIAAIIAKRFDYRLHALSVELAVAQLIGCGAGGKRRCGDEVVKAALGQLRAEGLWRENGPAGEVDICLPRPLPKVATPSAQEERDRCIERYGELGVFPPQLRPRLQKWGELTA